MINNILKNIKFKYRKYREINNVIGFIVNVHNATNYDIDLLLPQNIHDKYKNVIINSYTYQELDDNLNICSDIKTGSTYRCRLKGVGIDYNTKTINNPKNYTINIDIKQIIDRTNGMVLCNISDIDVYKRLLVEIIVPTSTEDINIKNYVLKNMKTEAYPLYYPYVFKYKKT